VNVVLGAGVTWPLEGWERVNLRPGELKIPKSEYTVLILLPLIYSN
jgi:hypothetical protein